MEHFGKKNLRSDIRKHQDEPRRRFDILAPLSFIVPLVIYWRTLCPVVFYGDSGELITAAKVGGLAFPTGYPAYIISLAIFLRIPLGWLAPSLETIDKLAWQANLLSAIFGALACFVLYLLLRRITKLPLAAFAAALCFAFSRTLWQQSLVAEVYSLNALLCVCILYFDLRLWEEKRGRYLILRWLFQALALANHPMSLFFIPVGLYISLLYLFRSEERKKLKRVGYAILAFMLGLSLYLYLPIASSFDPPLDYENPETLGNFWKVVSRATYSDEFSRWQWGEGGLQTLELGGTFSKWSLDNLGPAILPLAIIGVIAVFRIRDGRRGYRFGVLLTQILLLAFFWIYYRGVSELDVRFMEVYYIPNHMMTILLAVWGLTYLVSVILPDPQRVYSSRYALGMGVFILLIAISICASNYKESDRSRNLIAHYYLEDVLNTLPDERPKILVTSGDDIFLFWYLKYAHNLLPDTIVIGGNTFLASRDNWYWQWMLRENPDLNIPDIEDVIRDAKGDRQMLGKLYISRLYQANKQRYDILFTNFSERIAPDTVDPSISRYLRGVLMQLVDSGSEADGLYLEETLFKTYNLDAILALDYDTFDFYEKELFSRYALPLYNYARFFMSINDSGRSLEFFALARPFLKGLDNDEFEGQVKNEIGLAYSRAAMLTDDEQRKAELYGKAKEIFSELVHLFPGKAIYHAHLAKLYHFEGDTGKALEEANKALELDPENPFIQRLIERIEKRDPVEDDFPSE